MEQRGQLQQWNLTAQFLNKLNNTGSLSSLDEVAFGAQKVRVTHGVLFDVFVYNLLNCQRSASSHLYQQMVDKTYSLFQQVNECHF